jgi:hypothetical protein
MYPITNWGQAPLLDGKFTPETWAAMNFAHSLHRSKQAKMERENEGDHDNLYHRERALAVAELRSERPSQRIRVASVQHQRPVAE